MKSDQLQSQFLNYFLGNPSLGIKNLTSELKQLSISEYYKVRNEIKQLFEK